MTSQVASGDNANGYGLLVHTGTAGTAETMKAVGTDGALYVYDLAPAGSLTVGSLSVTSIESVGTLNSGTITRLEGGTIGLISSVATVPGIGSISNVAIIHNAGTIAGLPNVPGGTLGVVSSLTTGSIVVTAGTVSVLPNLPQGSINVTAGTFRDDGRPARNVLTYGTQFGGTAAGYATLVGSAAVGAGTSTWLNSISVSNSRSASLDVSVGFGTALAGTSVFVRDQVGTSIGIGRQVTYPKAVNAGMTNQDLTVYIGAAGTIDVSVSYFISA